MCHYRALEMDKAGLRERLVKVKDAGGLPFDHGEFELVVEPVPAPAAPPVRARDRILVNG
jgi:hypothetical protein